MSIVDSLQGVALVLNASPDIAELAKLLHFPREKVGCGAENVHLSIGTLLAIMSTVNVHCPRRADTVANKCRPLNVASLLSKINQFGDSISVEKAHVGRFNLPRLMLSISGKFSKINWEEGSVDETMNQVVDQLAEHQHSRIGLSKKGVKAGEDVLCSGSPNVKVMSDFR